MKSESARSVRCLNCYGIVTHNPKQITGCNCDPDAPQWCYINKEGDVRGWSLSKWEEIHAQA